MKRLLASIHAQVVAEVLERLRSPATLVALAAVLAGSILWIPDPAGNVSSLSWDVPGGRAQAPQYGAAYLGFASAVLVSLVVPLVGFYLVAGSVRRDRERRVGAILAATPLSRTAYLGGKLAAHAAYLSVVASIAVAAGLLAWVRFGVGTFSAVAFLSPPLLLGMPAVVAVASLAVLFDVTPGLRGRAGLVVWFFAFMFLLVALPLTLAGGPSSAGPRFFPWFDPAGAATQVWCARQTLPHLATGLSTGLRIDDAPFDRVPWPGIAIDARLLIARAANLLVALAPLPLAVVLFDRFDPARAPRRRERHGRAPSAGAATAEAGVDVASASGLVLAPASCRPSVARAVMAEARLLWRLAPLVRWLLVASAVVAAVAPEPVGSGALAAFLVLLVPVVSEAAAREELAGTRGLVHAQPGVPAFRVLWKAGAIAALLGTLLAPLLLRRLVATPGSAAVLCLGVLSVAALAAGLGSLSGGGKLFTGGYAALWYMGASGLQAADFAGAFGEPSLGRSAAYAVAGIVVLAGAEVRDRVRRR